MTRARENGRFRCRNRLLQREREREREGLRKKKTSEWLITQSRIQDIVVL